MQEMMKTVEDELSEKDCVNSSNHQKLLSKNTKKTTLKTRNCTIGGNILPINKLYELHYDSQEDICREIHYRDAICGMCEKTVSLALNVPLANLRARTRSTAEIALARQIAMYLCHTTFSVLLTEVGLYFGRDRSTVAHACSVVEDRRDDLSFDVLICQLEALLNDARQGMGICFVHGCFDDAVIPLESASGLSAYPRALNRGLI